MNPKQIEKDAFEEIVLQVLFGANWRDNNLLVLVNAYRPNLVQGFVNKFETLIDPFMCENGNVNGCLLRTALQSRNSFIAELIPDREFRLTEVAKEIIRLVRG